jgi:hypothetical protein
MQDQIHAGLVSETNAFHTESLRVMRDPLKVRSKFTSYKVSKSYTTP